MKTLAIAAIMLASASSAADVTLRRAPGQVVEAPAIGNPTGASAAGLEVDGTVIGWDRIASVRGAGEAAAAPYLALAQQAWRARVRLERGDLAGAEPLFESMASNLIGVRGPTPAMVFEGLCRCRVARGSTVPAIEAWLSWIDASSRDGPLDRSFDESAEVDSRRPPIVWIGVDSSTKMVQSLPPIFLPGPSLMSFIERSSSAGTGASDWRRIYVAAARFELGESVELGADAPQADGLDLAFQIVRARVSDDQGRREARGWIAERLRKEPLPWIEAWLRVGLGRSLLREADEDSVRIGVAALLHVPARLGAEAPYLAGLALAESAVALKGLSDRAGADQLRDELLERFPGHPASEWGEIRTWVYPALKSSKTGGQP